MTIAYILRTDDSDWTDPFEFSVARSKYRKKLENSEPMFRTFKPDDEDWSFKKTLPKAMNTFNRVVPNLGIGEVFKTKGNDGSGRAHVIKKVQVGLPERNPAFDASSGSSTIERVARVAAGFDPSVRTAGIAYTRKIRGTSTWSQHSHWPRLGCQGNAIDLYFPLPPPRGNDLYRQRRLVAYLLDNADELNINMIISEKTYWSKENNWQPRYYSGISHVSHTHIEGWPPQYGNPC